MISENFSEVLSALLVTQFFGWFIFIVVIVVLAVFTPFIIGRIFLFKKCGKAWWKAIIPVYGTYVQDVEIAGLHWAFFLVEEILIFFPTKSFYWISSLLTIVVKAMSFYNLAKKCHKDPIAPAILGGIVPGIFTMIYGFSQNTIFDQNVEVGNCSFFDNIIK